MFSSSLRAARPLMARVARQQTRRTLFTPTSVRCADLVQDMYLRELKSYKSPQVKVQDAQGQVAEFSLPKAPKSPEESDLANDLKSYESQQVEIEGQAASSEGEPAAPVEEDWFEEEEEAQPSAAH